MRLDIVKHKFIYLAISAILLIPGIIAMIYSMITYDTHTPVKVGIDYTTVSMDEIEEKGTGLARVKVTPDDMTSIQTPVEVRATFNLGAGNHRFKPELHARWTHEFGDTAGSGKGLFVKQNQPFGVKGLNADEDTFTLGGSLLWLYNVSELEVKYDYDFSSSSTGHSVNASYKYLF